MDAGDLEGVGGAATAEIRPLHRVLLAVGTDPARILYLFVLNNAYGLGLGKPEHRWWRVGCRCHELCTFVSCAYTVCTPVFVLALGCAGMALQIYLAEKQVYEKIKKGAPPNGEVVMAATHPATYHQQRISRCYTV